MNEKLTKWASIAEIVGTAAVVISLIFVIRSIDQNTRVVEAAEANNIWQAWRQTVQLPVINNADFALIFAKASSSQPLTEVEQVRWDRFLAAQIDIWAQMFDSYSNDLISRDLWNYWDAGFVEGWTAGHERIWRTYRDGYNANFQAHIDSNTQLPD